MVLSGRPSSLKKWHERSGTAAEELFEDDDATPTAASLSATVGVIPKLSFGGEGGRGGGGREAIPKLSFGGTSAFGASLGAATVDGAAVVTALVAKDEVASKAAVAPSSLPGPSSAAGLAFGTSPPTLGLQATPPASTSTQMVAGGAAMTGSAPASSGSAPVSSSSSPSSGSRALCRCCCCGCCGGW